MTDQLDMVAQAKKDGVKRFVPSEFGVDHRITKADFFKPKMEVLEAIEKAKFPDGMSFLLVFPKFPFQGGTSTESYINRLDSDRQRLHGDNYTSIHPCRSPAGHHHCEGSR